MKNVILILLLPLTSLCQTDSTSNFDYEIVEENYYILKHELNSNWKNIAVDTLSPTVVKADFDGDGKLDICALYSGHSPGLYIFSDLSGIFESKYCIIFDNDWYDENGFKAIISKGNKGDTLKFKSKNIVANNDFINIHFIDGTVQSLLSFENQFIIINN